MITCDTALIAVFRNLINQSLGLSRGSLKVTDCEAYLQPDLPGACVVQFKLAEGRASQTMGYLPAPADEASRTLFEHATETREGLEPTDAFERMQALRVLLDVIEGRVEGGIIQYTKTLKKEDIELALNGTEEPAGDKTLQTLDEFVDFRLVMLDVLSGNYAPYIDKPEEDYSYEAYAFEADPFSTILSLNFERGTTSLIFVLSSIADGENPALEKAMEDYLSARLDGNNRKAAEKASSASFKPLSEREAFERLGRLLAEEREGGITVWRPLTVGPISPSTLAKIQEFCAQSDTAEGEDAVSLALPGNLFGVALLSLEADSEETASNTGLKVSEEVTFELLTHKDHPAVSVIIGLTPHLGNIAGIWSAFSRDADSLNTALPDIVRMIEERKVFTAHPKPLAEAHPFIQTDRKHYARELAAINEAIRRQEGVLHEHIEPRAFEETVAAVSPFAPMILKKTLH